MCCQEKMSGTMAPCFLGPICMSDFSRVSFSSSLNASSSEGPEDVSAADLDPRLNSTIILSWTAAALNSVKTRSPMKKIDPKAIIIPKFYDNSLSSTLNVRESDHTIQVFEKE